MKQTKGVRVINNVHWTSLITYYHITGRCIIWRVALPHRYLYLTYLSLSFSLSLSALVPHTSLARSTQLRDRAPRAPPCNHPSTMPATRMTRDARCQLCCVLNDPPVDRGSPQAPRPAPRRSPAAHTVPAMSPLLATPPPPPPHYLRTDDGITKQRMRVATPCSFETSQWP